MAARDENFLDGPGATVDPFTGLAPAETPEEEARRRLMQLRYNQTQTRNINYDPNGGYQEGRSSGVTGPVTDEQKSAADAWMRENNRGDYAHSLGHNLIRDPVTMGVLAAPAVVTGLGAAVGGASALGFGVGEGSIAGAPAVGYASESAPFSMATPTAFSMPSPYAAGASGTGAAGAAGGSAAGGATGAMGFAKNIGLPALEMLGPLAIQQMTGGRTKEQKQLVEAQQQMALEAQKRQGQVQDQRMNMLAQQVLAFNPRNQQLAQMVGPQAAFSPEQAAQMVQGPAPPEDPFLANYAGNDQNILKQKQEYIRRRNEYAASEAARRDMMMNNFQAPGPGPTPINMPAPQAARRF